MLRCKVSIDTPNERSFATHESSHLSIVPRVVGDTLACIRTNNVMSQAM